MSNNLGITSLTAGQSGKIVTVNDMKGAIDAAITEALTFTWAGAETNKTPTTAQLQQNVAFVLAGSTSDVPTFKLTDGVERGIILIKNDLAQDVAVSSETPAIDPITVKAGEVIFVYFNGIEVYGIRAADPVTWHSPVRLASVGNVTIATALNSGDTFDGETLAEDDRILLKDQTDASENGIWVVDATPFRALDADAAGELKSGSAVPVTEGTSAEMIYILATNGTITPGTTDQTWVPFGGADLLDPIQTGEMIAGLIETVQDKSYKIVVKARHAGTITETTTISESGTATATFKINSTALGGTANSVSNVEQSQAHSSNNAFVAGDDIVITVSANSTCLGLAFCIQYTRTYET